jgi:hypothetical protein
MEAKAARVTNCAASVAATDKVQLTLSLAFAPTQSQLDKIKLILANLTKIQTFNSLNVSAVGQTVTVDLSDAAAGSAGNLIVSILSRNAEYFKLRDNTMGTVNSASVRATGTGNTAAGLAVSFVLLTIVLLAQVL